jgi:hypothetical protein
MGTDTGGATHGKERDETEQGRCHFSVFFEGEYSERRRTAVDVDGVNERM